jgi:RNA polymerase sigma factor (sigma-70 family)
MKNLESLVIRYQQTKDETVFNEIYAEVTSRWERFLNGLYRKYYNVDPHDINSIAHEKLYKVAMKFDESKGSFMDVLSVSIKNAVINEFKKKHRRIKHETLVSATTDDEGNEIDPMEYLATANAEDEIIEKINGREQRQLIRDLLERVDDKTRQNIVAYVQTGSFRKAAKLTGMTHAAVIKRFKKLADQLNDYITA